ncbi:Dead box protein 80 [Strongyloides ratti]|uniref:RNA helicase n=1 Tax=Strongyloides ratti TaxID=34506 RepID=A0A090L192_STRRB|nr:Dead box protein 80 [Strongyloides ratti]CEF61887.1 Dead box protein 80 [Strongyloides ratti]
MEDENEVEKDIPKEEISLLNKILNSRLEELKKGTVEVLSQQQNPDSPLYSADSFYSLRLKKELLDRLPEINYLMPSNIQGTALPLLLQEPPYDLIAQSQSGTGKTATFVLTMLHKINISDMEPQCICMAPTLELAKQIGEVVSSLGKKMEGLKIFYAIKDNHPTESIKSHIVIGTPGTVYKLITKIPIRLNLSNIKCFVLDEADVMVSTQGYQTMSVLIHKKILFQSPKVQTMLFSATFEENVKKLATALVPNAIILSIKKELLALDNIKQYYVKCDSREYKYMALCNLYGALTIASTIIFTHTKASSDWITYKLEERGRKVLRLHGNLTSQQRINTVKDFRDEKARVLVTTNVAARGLDFPQVTLVINYDLPLDNKGDPDFDVYYHRIGRTGRFGKFGIAINFIDSQKSMEQMLAIQSYFNKEIVSLDPENFDEVEAIQNS